MKKMKLIGGLLIFGLLSSCVAKKDYDQLLSSKLNLQNEVDELRKRDKDCEKTEATLAQLEEDYSMRTKDLEDTKAMLARADAAHDELMKEYDVLFNQHNAVLHKSSEEIAQLADELAKKEMEIARQFEVLEDLQAELEMKERNLAILEEEMNATSNQLAEREARIDALNEELQMQEQVMSALKDKISAALLGFSESDLTVRQEGGRVYVSMSQELLFAKASDNIDAVGRRAIKKLATVLIANPDIDINVEGHTDSDGTPEFNWDLSVTRATAVVKVLTSEGVNPKRITASGRALYIPLVENDTEANKSKNRRTEIVLSPRLDELYRLINQ